MDEIAKAEAATAAARAERLRLFEARRAAAAKEVGVAAQLGSVLCLIPVLASGMLVAMGDAGVVRFAIVAPLLVALAATLFFTGRAAARGSLGALTTVAALWTLVCVAALAGALYVAIADHKWVRTAVLLIPLALAARSWRARGLYAAPPPA